MDKKQRISWGVSFGSLALVAGMVSYLGLSNGDKENNQMSPQNNNFNGQQPNGFFSNNGQDQTQNFDQPFGGDDSSQFGQDDGSSNNNSDDNSQFFGNDDQNQFFGNNDGQNQFQGGGRFGGSGHHRGFDTTTGGT